jgi:hypothetical protein
VRRALEVVWLTVGILLITWWAAGTHAQPPAPTWAVAVLPVWCVYAAIKELRR